LKIINKDVGIIGGQLININKKINQTINITVKTEQKLKSSNTNLKDLLNKIRKGDKLCVDIILVCVCLGLIAILYNLIKSKI
jgi:hypothetical protein